MLKQCCSLAAVALMLALFVGSGTKRAAHTPPLSEPVGQSSEERKAESAQADDSSDKWAEGERVAVAQPAPRR